MKRVDAFAVIADPTRRRIMDTLRGGGTDVGAHSLRGLIFRSRWRPSTCAVLRDAGAVDVAGGRQTPRLPAGRGSRCPRCWRGSPRTTAQWSMSLDRLTDLIDEEQS